MTIRVESGSVDNKHGTLPVLLVKSMSGHPSSSTFHVASNVAPKP